MDSLRAGTARFFHEKGVREILQEFAQAIALHEPEDPRLFIYERLHARYAERSRSLSGKSKSLPGERDGPGVEKAGHAELFQAAESALQCKSTEELWKAEAQRGEAFSQTSNQAIDMLLNSWSALNLNGRSLQEIIRQSDVNQDGMLDKAELLAIMKANNLSVKEPDVDKVWRFVASSSSEANAKVGVEELQRAINLAVDRKYLADWIGEMKIHELISSHLLSDCRQPGMGRANPVKYLVDRAPNEVLRQIQAAVPDIQRAVCKAVADFLESTQGSKRSTSQAPGGGSKFSWSVSDGKKMRDALFGDTDFFRKGLNDLIGLPDAQIEEAMKAEHLSEDEFTTSNYNTTTTPLKEWQFVVDYQEGEPYAGTDGGEGREHVSLDKLMQARPKSLHGDASCQGCEHCLTREEVIALRLYTGPMYMFYNRVLRNLLIEYNKRQEQAVSRTTSGQGGNHNGGPVSKPDALPAAAEDLAQGSGAASLGVREAVDFCTTIHMISSGIVKLSEVMRRPETRKLYRGLSRMKLPDRLYEEDELGWKGAVEVAFMSCTLKREVALQYIGEGVMPIMFEIETSQIDRGASLEWVSQYPNEAEVLLPPLSNLEVTGEPKMVIDQGKPIIVFPMQLNVNLKIMKREEHEARRKTLHLASVGNASMEVERDLQAACQIKHAMPNKNPKRARKIVEKIMAEVNKLIAMQASRPVTWYNHDRNYKIALEEIALLKEMAIAKFKWWQASPSVTLQNIDQLSMLQVMKFDNSKTYSRYCELKDRYSVREFKLEGGQITRDEFEEGLKRVSRRAPEHAWFSDVAPEEECKKLRDRIWNELKTDHTRDTLSIGEFARLRKVTSLSEGRIEINSELAARTGNVVTLHDELKQAALKVVEAYVDDDNLDVKYGVDSDTALITAASQGDDGELELYLDAGCDIKARNNKGYSAIASAACQGMDDCLEILIRAAEEQSLDAEELINTTTERDESPLQLAAMNGWTDCVSVLLKRGAKTRHENVDGFNAFLSAAEYGHLEIVQLIYEKDEGIIFERNRLKGWTALHLAARNGHRLVVDFLYEKGGSKLLKINRSDGRTPLMSCVRGGTREDDDMNFGKSTKWERGRIASNLISWCPEMLTALDDEGRSCLHIAADEDHVKMFEFLLEKICQMHGSSKATEMLLKLDHSHMNCMHSSCMKRGTEVFSWLTDKASYARTLFDEKDGKRIFFDEQQGEALCRKLLLAPSLNGRTCLHLAAGCGRRKIVTCLLDVLKRYELLELVSKTTEDGRTAAVSAANFGHLDVLKLIATCQEIEFNVATAQDKNGWTALHWVADSEGGAATFVDHEAAGRSEYLMEDTKKEGSAVEIIEYLCSLQQECTDSRHMLFQIDSSGRTALHLAARFGSVDLVDAMLRMARGIGGAETLMKMKRSNGMLALHGAAHLGRCSIIAALCDFGGEDIGTEMATSPDLSGWIPVFWSLAGLQKRHAGAPEDASRDRKQATILLRRYGGQKGVDWKDDSGMTGLHLACATDDMDLVALFLDQADSPPKELSAEGAEHAEHADAAISKEHYKQRRAARLEEVTKVASSRITWVEAGMSSIHFAARSGAATVLGELCRDYELDTDARDALGRHALHHACLSKSLGVVECLLQASTESERATVQRLLFAADNLGHTCLHLACGAAEELESMADVSMLDSLDQDLDVEDEDEKKEKKMMEEGPSERDQTSIPVMLRPSPSVLEAPKSLRSLGEPQAMPARRQVVARLCQVAGPSLCSQKDKDGRTALHWCALKGYLRRFCILLQSGADASARSELVLAVDNDGKTCVELADPDALEKIMEEVREQVGAECAAKLMPHTANAAE